MWFSFWRSRDRFSLNELRYLVDQLEKIQIVNEVNKDFIIEALRSIAELITYGDQHDPSFFEFFMEKQVMGEFVRLLKAGVTMNVSLQLLQTISIMIQNLKSEHALYYIFSNEHINYLIMYDFDFQNEELLSYYISFLRAISGKLNKNTISLLVKTQGDEIVSFPLYIEAIRFAFHEENMIRTAVRALTLNVYHVGDDCVCRYIARTPQADYFTDRVKFFRRQCSDLNGLVMTASKNTSPESTSGILSAVDEIEDGLYYFSDVISAGIPDVGRLIADSIFQILIFPLLLPSLRMETVDEMQMGAVTSFYLLCCILRIVKLKDLANIIAAALFCPAEALLPTCKAKPNGYIPTPDMFHKEQLPNHDNLGGIEGSCGHRKVGIPSLVTTSTHPEEAIMQQDHDSASFALREVLLSCITEGNDVQVLGSLNVLSTLLQTKELDESMLDALGILPQRKQHKKLLLQALVGEGSGEEQLFSSESSIMRDDTCSSLDSCLQQLKEQYGVVCSCLEAGISPRVHRFQVLDALACLFCRSNISAETLWVGGWLLRQLLPYSVAEFNNRHLKLINDSYKNCIICLLHEVRGVWQDLLVSVLCNEWKKCKRAIEASAPVKEPKCMLFPAQKSSFGETMPESSFVAGERLSEVVKVFVLLLQIQIFTLGTAFLPEQPPICPPIDTPADSRAKAAGLDILGPKAGTELKLVEAVPCRIAFERGKERHFRFLALSIGTSGWVILAEELPLKEHYGVIRVAAPLAGCNPKIDEKHSRWLHLRVRPSTLPSLDPGKSSHHGRAKTKALVDGRWTLAFRDEEACRSAIFMISQELDSQSSEVERQIKPLLDVDRAVGFLNSSRSSSLITAISDSWSVT